MRYRCPSCAHSTGPSMSLCHRTAARVGVRCEPGSDRVSVLVDDRDRQRCSFGNCTVIDQPLHRGRAAGGLRRRAGLSGDGGRRRSEHRSGSFRGPAGSSRSSPRLRCRSYGRRDAPNYDQPRERSGSTLDDVLQSLLHDCADAAAPLAAEFGRDLKPQRYVTDDRQRPLDLVRRLEPLIAELPTKLGREGGPHRTRISLHVLHQAHRYNWTFGARPRTPSSSSAELDFYMPPQRSADRRPRQRSAAGDCARRVVAGWPGGHHRGRR